MKREAVLVVSLAAGLLAAALTRLYISGKEDELLRVRARFKAEYGEMEALCFAADTASGTVIDASALSTCKTYRKGNEGVVLEPLNISDIVGRRTVGFHRKGDPLRWNDVEGGDSRRGALSADISPRMRAVSIGVNSTSSVSCMVRPGDWVDVIGTFDFPDPSSPGRRGDPVTCTILQKVLVLATGQETAKSRPPAFGAPQKGYSAVTLSVTPREAEMLAFAEQIKGRLTLTLRNRDDTGVEEELPTVDFKKIRSEIEDLNRERNPKDRRRARRTASGEAF